MAGCHHVDPGAGRTTCRRISGTGSLKPIIPRKIALVLPVPGTMLVSMRFITTGPLLCSLKISSIGSRVISLTLKNCRITPERNHSLNIDVMQGDNLFNAMWGLYVFHPYNVFSKLPLTALNSCRFLSDPSIHVRYFTVILRARVSRRCQREEAKFSVPCFIPVRRRSFSYSYRARSGGKTIEEISVISLLHNITCISNGFGDLAGEIGPFLRVYPLIQDPSFTFSTRTLTPYHR